MMVDGSLTDNAASHSVGTSARVCRDGYWGFASESSGVEANSQKLLSKANRNAQAMSAFGSKQPLNLPTSHYRGEHIFQGKTPFTKQECIDWLQTLDGLCRDKYPKLSSMQFFLSSEQHNKHLLTSTDSDVYSSVLRSECMCIFSIEGKDGQPVELYDWISGKGGIADLDLNLSVMEQRLDELYQHLMAKREAVPAVGGNHTLIFAPTLTGMLAHEAMGHPCEADIVQGGAATCELLGEQVASDLITMVDFAHHYDGLETQIPVYADDEGTPANDVVMIDKGVLNGFMHSRETSAEMEMPLTGNARAYDINDEPLIRMRNTAILPGTDSYNDMIEGVEQGYLLLSSSNGQADSTTEFMFGVDLGYEIKNGKLGRAIKDTTVSGKAMDVLRSVDAVADDMQWECGGYCGKKQMMLVSVGGPSLRATAHLGGE
ncbi:TldD/PmbA family protein [Corallincola platygyrae]